MSRIPWQEAVAGLDDGLAVLDADGRIVGFNPAFVRLISPDVPVCGAALPDWLAGRAIDGAIARIERDGQRLDLRRAALSDGMAALVLSDAPPATTASDAVFASSARFAAIVDAAPVAVVMTDAAQVVRSWNRAAEAMFGWTEQEALGRNYTFVVPPPEREAFRALFRRVLAGEGLTGLRVERMHRSGARIHASVSTAAVRDAHGHIVGVVAFLDDLSERLRLEAQIRSVERTEAIGRLAGGVAHDFNNLLTVILAACDRLDDAEDARQRARLVDEVRKGADRAAELTRALLAYSRRQVLSPACLDLSQAVRAILPMIERLLGDRVAVDAALCAEPLMVTADPSELQRVVINLAINARDAMEGVGRLTVETRRDGDVAALVVADTGPGIPAEHLAHVFEPFWSTKGHGTGLGLAMVVGFVEQSGGQVRVANGEPGGARFEVRLPVAADAGEARRERSTPPAANGRPGAVQRPGAPATVLVVDDEPQVCEAVQAMLAARGYHVLVANGPEEALAVESSFEGPIDVLLTDIVMPNKTGRELWTEFSPRRPRARVLFMSGHTDDVGFRVGGRPAFIHKPFTGPGLDGAVRRLLAAPSLSD